MINKSSERIGKEKNLKNNDDLNFRFKSSLKLKMKDGGENVQVISNSIFTESRKE
jgi:hypothetical protein